MNVIDLSEKVVIVTGGAQGIGRAIVKDFAQSGADVVIADIQMGAAQQTANDISQATGQKVIVVRTDVTDLENVQQMTDQVFEQFGQIDVLVNNAGWDRFIPFMETTPDFWEKVISINYRGVLNLCYAVLPHMVEAKSGSIVTLLLMQGVEAAWVSPFMQAAKRR